MEHLAGALKKGEIKEISSFFPPNKRDKEAICDFFREKGLDQVADWWTKKKYEILKEEIIQVMKENQRGGGSNEDVRKYSLL